MIVLGIDPGTASTGYGLVHGDRSRLSALEDGVIRTPAGTPLERRLADIHARVGELLDVHRPEAVAIEELYFGANARTAFAVGQARGVVLLAAGQRGIPSRSYTPQQVKGAVCGHGRAGKEQVGRMVARLLGLPAPPAPDHAADALAVAICDLNRAPLARALDGAGRRAEALDGAGRGAGALEGPGRRAEALDAAGRRAEALDGTRAGA
jgi:crossover junction endodeoxyribonuclease RuvC